MGALLDAFVLRRDSEGGGTRLRQSRTRLPASLPHPRQLCNPSLLSVKACTMPRWQGGAQADREEREPGAINALKRSER